MGEPWWSPGAISYLATHLTNGARVWEWGSGGSTIWLMERDAKVTSIEEDPEWAAKVEQRCPSADVRFIGGDDSGVLRSRQWERSEHFFDRYVCAVDDEPDESLDVAIVDGRCRLDCVRHAVPKVREGGLLIIDDTEKPFLSFGPYLPELDGWHVEKRGASSDARSFMPRRPSCTSRGLRPNCSVSPDSRDGLIDPSGGRVSVLCRSGESSGFFDSMLPDDRQSEDSHRAGQNEPMAEGQGVPVE